MTRAGKRRACALATVLVAAVATGGGGGGVAVGQSPRPEGIRGLAPAVVEGQWIRPAAEGAAVPLWGHAEGLRVGLHPLAGPRGLLRVYAPYLGHRDQRMINFIAVEPTASGERHRGYSELEPSRLDAVAGKRFWSVDDPADRDPRSPDRPSRGQLVRDEDGTEVLQVFVQVEPFDNGSKVYVRMRFRADRPHEVGLAAYAHADSRAMESCTLSATMGNFARLRRLHLKDRVVSSLELWPEYKDEHFTPHARFPLDQMERNGAGHALVRATPDEPDPVSATYAEGTGRGWRYDGKLATQYWRVEAPQPQTVVSVNGRFTYWASRSPIPGGISFENFELVTPFRQGEELWFGVEPGVASGPTVPDHADPHPAPAGVDVDAGGAAR